MRNDERQEANGRSDGPVSPGADPAVPRFAWGYLFAILLGTAIIIAIVCTIATLSKKKEADFSYRQEAHQPDRI
jgi:cytoskeletal protein RodZ